MNQLHTIMIVLAIVASFGIIVNFLVESADAWHSAFSSKKECTDLFKEIGNTSWQANRACLKNIPH